MCWSCREVRMSQPLYCQVPLKHNAWLRLPSHQCDQMVRLFCLYLAIRNKETVPVNIRHLQKGLKFLPNIDYSLKNGPNVAKFRYKLVTLTSSHKRVGNYKRHNHTYFQFSNDTHFLHTICQAMWYKSGYSVPQIQQIWQSFELTTYLLSTQSM